MAESYKSKNTSHYRQYGRKPERCEFPPNRARRGPGPKRVDRELEVVQMIESEVGEAACCGHFSDLVGRRIRLKYFFLAGAFKRTNLTESRAQSEYLLELHFGLPRERLSTYRFRDQVANCENRGESEAQDLHVSDYHCDIVALGT